MKFKVLSEKDNEFANKLQQLSIALYSLCFDFFVKTHSISIHQLCSLVDRSIPVQPVYRNDPWKYINIREQVDRKRSCDEYGFD